MTRRMMLALAVLQTARALHMVVSRDSALSIATRWRNHHSIARYRSAVESLKDDNVVPVVQYDDVRGLALMLFRQDPGGKHRITTHLSNLDVTQESRSRSECALWYLKLVAEQEREAEMCRAMLEVIFEAMQSHLDLSDGASDDVESLSSEFLEDMSDDA